MKRDPLLLLGSVFGLAALSPLAAAAQSAVSAPAVETPVQLSAFEVIAEQGGYHATNTTAGTRLNSKIEDIGASITVVTKEQMGDFAMLDLNDIFNYEASTEGTGNFTSYAIDVYGSPVDNVKLDPGRANRIRGLGAANVTLGNFETSGRVPIDPLNIDGVEISRGPNSSLFGIGNTSGTVNSVPASANLNRNSSRASVRGDDAGGHRTTVDLNRVLKPGILAIRGSAAYQTDAYELKPSGVHASRLNGMVAYRPFKRTRITGSHFLYRMQGVRANATMPRESISTWLAAGSPTWDPVARTVKVNGTVVGTFPTGIPTRYFEGIPGASYSKIDVDRAGITYWGAARTTSSTDPNVASGAGALMIARSDDFRASQPLFATRPVLGDRRYYDWTSINLNAGNRVEDDSSMTTVLLDQTLIDNGRHQVAVQMGWFRETNERLTANANNLARAASILEVDVNERRLDGTPNPNFLRPFIATGFPSTAQSGVDRNTYRAQMLYQLDARKESNWRRWIGLHRLAAYGEYKEYADQTNRLNYHSTVSSHAWIPPGQPHLSGASGGLPAGPLFVQGNYNFFLGDRSGYNVDHAPGTTQPGRYVMQYGNSNTGFVQESAELGTVVGFNTGSLAILKSWGGVLQSYLLKDRVVTTVGWRRDVRHDRSKRPLRLLPDGVTLDPISDEWASGDWQSGKGNTKTLGIVVKPLPWLNLHANRSNSFQPADPAMNIYREILPSPTGEGTDYGVRLSFFSGRLFVSVNRYEVSQDKRNGTQAPLNRLMLHEYTWSVAEGALPNAWNLAYNAEKWVLAAAASRGETLSATERDTRVAGIMKVPVEFLSEPGTGRVAMEDRDLAKGTEVEISYNPTKHWTAKMNVAEQKSIGAAVATSLSKYIEERLPVWPTIIDPTIGRPWYTERYNNGNSFADRVASGVLAPLDIARAQEGKSLPQVRKYRVNLSTRYSLAGMTDHRFWRQLNVGGAVRWEDRGAIGYHGMQALPAVVTKLDPGRPIFDDAHLNLDAFASYRTRLFSDRVGLTLQLNVRNLNESGRLQPIAADPDGSPSAFRIVDPRRFILSATFEL